MGQGFGMRSGKRDSAPSSANCFAEERPNLGQAPHSIRLGAKGARIGWLGAGDPGGTLNRHTLGCWKNRLRPVHPNPTAP